MQEGRWKYGKFTSICEISCPMLICGGDLDPFVTSDQLDGWKVATSNPTAVKRVFSGVISS